MRDSLQPSFAVQAQNLEAKYDHGDLPSLSVQRVQAVLQRSASQGGSEQRVNVELVAATEGAGITIDYQFADTPLGRVLVACTAKGICWMQFADAGTQEALQALRAAYPQATLRAQAHARQQQVLQVLAQDRHAGSRQALTLHLQGTPFQMKVWQALLAIPAGQLLSYGDLAKRIGAPRAARAVGSAIGSNPVAVLVPCHRVVRANGVIGEYRWLRGRKIALLAHELAAT